MSTTHLAAVLHAAQTLRLEQIKPPPLPANYVRIAPRATGLCGTDLHYYESGRNGIFSLTSPLILGHEAAGEILAVGADVTTLKPGDRVVIEPQRPCGACVRCRGGTYNLCPGMKFTGSASAVPPIQGTLQEVYQHAEGFVFKIPERVPYTEAALIEPLAVAVHAARRAGVQAGQQVLVIGAGAVGLLCAMVARVSGARRVGIVDVQEGRLEFALKQGYADYVVKTPVSGEEGEAKGEFAERAAREIVGGHEMFEPVDVCFECTGVEVCVNVGIYCAAPRGKVVLVGMGAPHQALNVGVTAVREVDLVSIWRYANTFETAIELVASGKLRLGPLVTHTFPLQQAGEALELVRARPKDLIKCVVTA
ncbi:chaperonin 10-like protein [Aspergillus crustosus]